MVGAGMEEADKRVIPIQTRLIKAARFASVPRRKRHSQLSLQCAMFSCRAREVLLINLTGKRGVPRGSAAACSSYLLIEKMVQNIPENLQIKVLGLVIFIFNTPSSLSDRHSFGKNALC